MSRSHSSTLKRLDIFSANDSKLIVEMSQSLQFIGLDFVFQTTQTLLSKAKDWKYTIETALIVEMG